MNNQTIQLGSQSIFVSIKPGKKGTVPLLLMNGIGASTSLLTPFVEALDRAYPDTEIITFDAPGTGGSSTPCLPYRFSGICKIVDQMIDHLGYNKVNVLGLSWGGMLAQEFTYQYPQRVGKLILAATCAGVMSVPPSMKVLSIMASPRRYTDAEYAIKVAPDIYGGKFRTDKTLAATHAKRVAASKTENEHSQLGYAYQTMAVYWWSSLYYLNQIKQPTLVLAGDDDPLIPLVNMKIMNRLFPNSQMKIFEGEGHLFLLTSLDRVILIIIEFLS